LNRAGIEAQYVSADALQVQAVIRYEQAVLQAVTDVTTQLTNVTNIQASYATRTQQVGRLTKSVEMSTVLFKAARADYVEVLLVRRDLLEAEFELIERRMELQQAVVGLYQALGGGWREAQRKG
jgi:outer membrane protein TolC